MLQLPLIAVLIICCACPPGPPAGGILEDCNRNGIEDSIDILYGSSSDMDQNGIHDECEGLRQDLYGPSLPF